MLHDWLANILLPARRSAQFHPIVNLPFHPERPMPDQQPTTILNDKAVESLKEDALDFTPYVQALADIAMTGSTPLTIGVFGTWGSGKTSLMRMVKEQVEAQGAAAGWFDAWKYDKEETLWRAFLLSVLFALEEAAAKNK
jgi:predicted KAP-like P-loop ATPase